MVQSYPRDLTRELRPSTRLGRSVINFVCISCKPLHASLFVVQLGLTIIFTYRITAYYGTNEGFNAKNASFYNHKVG